MTDSEWRTCFVQCAAVLGTGHKVRHLSMSWCAWTTYERLSEDAGYWNGGLPDPEDLEASHIKDGGIWGQPFPYADLAHLIVPRKFIWETPIGPNYGTGIRLQDVDALSIALRKSDIQHRVTPLVLEIKLF